MIRPFKSDLVLDERINETTLRAYHVGFDQNRFRLLPLVDLLASVIPEFALGLQEGGSVLLTAMVEKVREAAQTVYRTDKYERRGEFGELILHLLLRDFHNTIPLVSGIYFKDSANQQVKGFDGVHGSVEGGTRKLWLGESKIYSSGAAGISELCSDLGKHFAGDYLRQQFVLLKRKLPQSLKDVEEWRALMDSHRTLDAIFDSLVVPMVCTFGSRCCSEYCAETRDYLEAFEQECRDLHSQFSTCNVSTNVEVILLLLPVPDKGQLVDCLDSRLKAMQQI